MPGDAETQLRAWVDYYRDLGIHDFYRRGEPVELAAGLKRTFLEDGDSLVMRGWCQGDGYRVGFGEVEGTILAAE